MRLPKKEFICLSGAPITATVVQGTPPDLLVWRPSGITKIKNALVNTITELRKALEVEQQTRRSRRRN